MGKQFDARMNFALPLTCCYHHDTQKQHMPHFGQKNRRSCQHHNKPGERVSTHAPALREELRTWGAANGFTSCSCLLSGTGTV